MTVPYTYGQLLSMFQLMGGKTPDSFDLLTDRATNRAVVLSSPGVNAGALIDNNHPGLVSFVFFGAASSAQMGDGVSIASGADPASLAGFKAALNWVRDEMAAFNLSSENAIAVGFSLGGSQAQYVARELKLAGCAFAGAGLGHNTSSPNGTGFVNVIAEGDFFGQIGTDTDQPNWMSKFFGVRQDHYGSIIHLGTNQDARDLQKAWTDLDHSKWPWTPAAMRSAAATEMANIINSIHNPQHYLDNLIKDGLNDRPVTN